MTLAQKQAIYRFITVVGAAIVAAIATNAGPLLDLLTDPTYRLIAGIVLTGVLQGLLKLLAGPTLNPGPILGSPRGADTPDRWWGA